MKVWVNQWMGQQRIEAIFGNDALDDHAIDSDELKAAGLDDSFVTTLGIKDGDDLFNGRYERLIGAVILKQQGITTYASATSRKLQAECVGALSSHAMMSDAEASAVAKSMAKLPPAQQQNLLRLINECLSTSSMCEWLQDASQRNETLRWLLKMSELNAGIPDVLRMFRGTRPSDIEASYELAKSLVGKLKNDDFYAACELRTALLEEGVTDLKTQRDIMLLVCEQITKQAYFVNVLRGHLKYAELTKSNFTTRLGNAISDAVRANPDYASDMATLINEVHDLQIERGAGDSSRTKVIAALSDAAALSLLSGATHSLYFSTYDKLMASIRDRAPAGDVATWLRSEDPDAKHRLGVLATFARFRETELVTQSGETFVSAVAEALNNRYDPQRRQYIALAQALLEQGSPAMASELATLVTSKPTQVGRAEAALVLRHAYESGVMLPNHVAGLAASLPAVPSMQVPVESWLKDGAITAVQFGYLEKNGADPKAMRQYYAGEGFAVVPGTLFGLDASQTTVMERTYRGVKQRIVLTTDGTADRDAIIALPEVDLVVHRGHSYQTSQTFPQGASAAAVTDQKGLIDGACNGYNFVTSSKFIQAYGQHLLFADENIGQGKVNNPLVLKIMNGAALGKKDIATYGISGNGTVLPNVPELRALAYGRLLSSVDAATTQPVVPIEQPRVRLSNTLIRFAQPAH